MNVSHLLLSGEFGPALQPRTNRLLSAKGGRTTPAHRLLYEYGRDTSTLRTRALSVWYAGRYTGPTHYTTRLCDLQGSGVQ